MVTFFFFGAVDLMARAVTGRAIGDVILQLTFVPEVLFHLLLVAGTDQPFVPSLVQQMVSVVPVNNRRIRAFQFRAIAQINWHSLHIFRKPHAENRNNHQNHVITVPQGMHLLRQQKANLAREQPDDPSKLQLIQPPLPENHIPIPIHNQTQQQPLLHPIPDQLPTPTPTPPPKPHQEHPKNRPKIPHLPFPPNHTLRISRR